MTGYFWFELFVFANVLIVTLLGINVSRVRMREKVPHGDGDNVAMQKAIRTHGNGVEHVTIFALVVLALEFAAAPGALLGTLVIAFTISRLLHPVGMLGRPFNARRIGAGITFLCELVGVLALPVVALSG